MDLQTSDGPGEVRRSAGGNPVFVGLRRGVINLVLTDQLPPYWDNGRALAGVTTLLGRLSREHDRTPLCARQSDPVSFSEHLCP